MTLQNRAAKRRERERQRAAGLVPIQLWVPRERSGEALAACREAIEGLITSPPGSTTR